MRTYISRDICPHSIGTMSALCLHNVRTISAQCRHNVRTISFFGFQLRLSCMKRTVLLCFPCHSSFNFQCHNLLFGVWEVFQTRVINLKLNTVHCFLKFEISEHYENIFQRTNYQRSDRRYCELSVLIGHTDLRTDWCADKVICRDRFALETLETLNFSLENIFVQENSIL